MPKPIAIYACYNVRYPVGGHVLAELHYIVGLQRLGYDVYIMEESGTEWAPCFNPLTRECNRDPAHGLGVQIDTLRPLGLDRSWCYVDSEGKYRGLGADDVRRLCQQSTVLLSRAGVNWLPEFAECKRRIFVDVDPGRVQFQTKSRVEDTGSCSGYASPYDFHYHFTYGERIGKPDCPIPTHGLHWRPTRPPVVADLLPQRFTPDAPYFTTVMSWSSRPPLIYNGEAYGSKDMEFRRVIDLPQRVGPMFELALNGYQLPLEEIHANGWKTISALEPTKTVARYTDYIAQSRGEFSVAVNLVVKTRCGWFSDRTAAYLAAGKPVVVQDSGWTEFLPHGAGLFGFSDLEGAVRAVETINRDYPAHCRAARHVADEYFAAEKVLGDLLQQCDLPARSS